MERLSRRGAPRDARRSAARSHTEGVVYALRLLGHGLVQAAHILHEQLECLVLQLRGTRAVHGVGRALG